MHFRFTSCINCPPSPHVRQDGLARTVYRGRAGGAWTSPLLHPGMPSVIMLVKIGQSRRLHQTVWRQPVSCNNCFNSLHLQRAQVTDSQKPISTVMRVCHPYSIIWTILGAWEWFPQFVSLSCYLIWNTSCSQDNTLKWLDFISSVVQEWFRELSFSRLEYGVHKLHISSADWWDMLLPLA